MRILFITQYFKPETEVGGIKIWEISQHLIKKGHSVSVLTGFPNYPNGTIFQGYKIHRLKLFYSENIDRINVFRVFLFASHSKNILLRLLNYISFLIFSCIRSLTLPKFDLVIVTSPPLTVALSAIIIKKKQNFRKIFINWFCFYKYN